MNKFYLSSAKKRIVKDVVIISLALGALFFGSLVLWATTFELPDLNAFEQRKVAESTKIYDRTGKVLLYSVHENIKRTVVPNEEMSKNIKNATVAIEDAEFYQHRGIKPKSIVRAVFANLKSGKFSQGGSTITQQVIKNTFLTSEKTISRKVKEWVLALRLERVATKELILTTYLNEAPYGGNLYGVEEASQAYFGKTANDLTVAEAAYLAALPQAPTYYSPYGNHKQDLIARKNLVLNQMKENNFISEEEYKEAVAEKVNFRLREERGIKAPHFVIFVRERLVEKYGERAVEENGYKVITTLDYELQKKTEELTREYALKNKKQYDAENAGVVIMDPKTGQVLGMVGSRGYFDEEIDGNFNVTLAHRQPGSTFKPIVYAQAFKKGFVPETVVFDVKTQFSSNCSPSNLTSSGGCYSPDNYDEKYRGPISLRNALAQSVNIASVKVLHLAGLNDSLRLAKDLGIESLATASTYGLTLVLGGGEAALIDMTSAYAVFANEGRRNPYEVILKVEDRAGNVVEEFEKKETPVLPKDIALTVSDILSDNVARTPLYGPNSLLYFPGKDVAVKTGTTNDYKDAWTIGYTPTVVVGAWVGNNDNRPMDKKLSGLLVVPLWHAVMEEALKTVPEEKFSRPRAVDTSRYKPMVNGNWQGYVETANSGFPQVHSILHYVDVNDPLGPAPSNPARDSQYERWEYAVRSWSGRAGGSGTRDYGLPSGDQEIFDTVERKNYRITINRPKDGRKYALDEIIRVRLDYPSKFSPIKADFFNNGVYLGSSVEEPFNFSFIPSPGLNVFRAVLLDAEGNLGEDVSEFSAE